MGAVSSLGKGLTSTSLSSEIWAVWRGSSRVPRSRGAHASSCTPSTVTLRRDACFNGLLQWSPDLVAGDGRAASAWPASRCSSVRAYIAPRVTTCQSPGPWRRRRWRKQASVVELVGFPARFSSRARLVAAAVALVAYMPARGQGAAPAAPLSAWLEAIAGSAVALAAGDPAGAEVAARQA